VSTAVAAASLGAATVSFAATVVPLTRSSATQDAAGVIEHLNIKDSFGTADWTHRLPRCGCPAKDTLS
jgi:hypothetical protein